MVKTFLGTFVVISCLAVLSSGCSEEKSSEPGVVSYVTGAEQLKTYQKTKVKIHDIDNNLKETHQEIK